MVQSTYAAHLAQLSEKDRQLILHYFPDILQDPRTEFSEHHPHYRLTLPSPKEPDIMPEDTTSPTPEEKLTPTASEEQSLREGMRAALETDDRYTSDARKQRLITRQMRSVEQRAIAKDIDYGLGDIEQPEPQTHAERINRRLNNIADRQAIQRRAQEQRQREQAWRQPEQDRRNQLNTWIDENKGVLGPKATSLIRRQSQMEYFAEQYPRIQQAYASRGLGKLFQENEQEILAKFGFKTRRVQPYDEEQDRELLNPNFKRTEEKTWRRIPTALDLSERTTKDIKIGVPELPPRMAPAWEQPEHEEKRVKIENWLRRLNAIKRVQAGGVSSVEAALELPRINAALKADKIPRQVLAEMTATEQQYLQKEITKETFMSRMDAFAGRKAQDKEYKGLSTVMNWAQYGTRNQFLQKQIEMQPEINTFLNQLASNADITDEQRDTLIRGKGLTHEQYRFVTSPKKVQFVKGGPGAGKTYMDMIRLAYLKQQGVPVEEFMITGPTHTALHNMRDRMDAYAPLMTEFNAETGEISEPNFRDKSFDKQFRTPYGHAMSYLHTKHIPLRDEDGNPVLDEDGNVIKVTPMQHMKRYRGYQPLGITNTQSEQARTLGDAWDTHQVANFQAEYIQQVFDKYGAKNLSLTNVQDYINKLKGSRSFKNLETGTSDYISAFERGRDAFNKTGRISNEDSAFYAYEQSLHMAPDEKNGGRFRVNGQNEPKYDMIDSLYMATQGANIEGAKKFSGTFGDEEQDNLPQAIAMFEAMTRPGGHIILTGDPSQKNIYNEIDTARMAERVFTHSKNHDASEYEYSELTATNRLSPWIAALINAIASDPYMRDMPRSPFMVSNREDGWGTMPAITHHANINAEDAYAISTHLSDVGLTWANIKYNLEHPEESGNQNEPDPEKRIANAYHGAVIDPNQSVIGFTMDDRRDRFERSLLKTAQRELGTELGTQFFKDYYSANATSKEQVNKLHALKTSQMRSNEYSHVTMDFTHDGAWEVAGYLSQMYVLGSRPTDQLRLMASPEQVGKTKYRYETRPLDDGTMLPHGAYNLIERMINNFLYQQNGPFSEIPEQFRGMAQAPIIDENLQEVHQDNESLQELADFVKMANLYGFASTQVDPDDIMHKLEQLHIGETGDDVDINGEIASSGFNTFNNKVNADIINGRTNNTVDEERTHLALELGRQVWEGGPDQLERYGLENFLAPEELVKKDSPYLRRPRNEQGSFDKDQIQQAMLYHQQQIADIKEFMMRDADKHAINPYAALSFKALKSLDNMRKAAGDRSTETVTKLPGKYFRQMQLARGLLARVIQVPAGGAASVLPPGHLDTVMHQTIAHSRRMLNDLSLMSPEASDRLQLHEFERDPASAVIENAGRKKRFVGSDSFTEALANLDYMRDLAIKGAQKHPFQIAEGNTPVTLLPYGYLDAVAARSNTQLYNQAKAQLWKMNPHVTVRVPAEELDQVALPEGYLQQVARVAELKQQMAEYAYQSPNPYTVPSVKAQQSLEQMRKEAQVFSTATVTRLPSKYYRQMQLAKGLQQRARQADAQGLGQSEHLADYREQLGELNRLRKRAQLSSTASRTTLPEEYLNQSVLVNMLKNKVQGANRYDALVSQYQAQRKRLAAMRPQSQGQTLLRRPSESYATQVERVNTLRQQMLAGRNDGLQAFGNIHPNDVNMVLHHASLLPRGYFEAQQKVRDLLAANPLRTARDPEELDQYGDNQKGLEALDQPVNPEWEEASEYERALAYKHNRQYRADQKQNMQIYNERGSGVDKFGNSLRVQSNAQEERTRARAMVIMQQPEFRNHAMGRELLMSHMLHPHLLQQAHAFFQSDPLGGPFADIDVHRYNLLKQARMERNFPTIMQVYHKKPKDGLMPQTPLQELDTHISKARSKKYSSGAMNWYQAQRDSMLSSSKQTVRSLRQRADELPVSKEMEELVRSMINPSHANYHPAFAEHMWNATAEAIAGITETGTTKGDLTTGNMQTINSVVGDIIAGHDPNDPVAAHRARVFGKANSLLQASFAPDVRANEQDPLLNRGIEMTQEHFAYLLRTDPKQALAVFDILYNPKTKGFTPIAEARKAININTTQWDRPKIFTPKQLKEYKDAKGNIHQHVSRGEYDWSKFSVRLQRLADRLQNPGDEHGGASGIFDPDAGRSLREGSDAFIAKGDMVTLAGYQARLRDTIRAGQGRFSPERYRELQAQHAALGERLAAGTGEYTPEQLANLHVLHRRISRAITQGQKGYPIDPAQWAELTDHPEQFAQMFADPQRLDELKAYQARLGEQLKGKLGEDELAQLTEQHRHLGAILEDGKPKMDPQRLADLQANHDTVANMRKLLNDPRTMEQFGHFMNIATHAIYNQDPTWHDKTPEEIAKMEAEGRRRPIDHLFQHIENRYKPGNFTIEHMIGFYSSLHQAMSHMQRTGNLNRGQIDDLLQAMGHDPRDPMFEGLRTFERPYFQGPSFTRSEDELPLNALIHQYRKKPDVMRRFFGQFTRFPLHEGEEVTFDGPAKGDFQQGLVSGAMGTLSPFPQLTYEDIANMVNNLEIAKERPDYTRYPLLKFGYADNKRTMVRLGLLDHAGRNEIESYYGSKRFTSIPWEHPMGAPLLFNQQQADGSTIQYPVLPDQLIPTADYERIKNGGGEFLLAPPSSHVALPEEQEPAPQTLAPYVKQQTDLPEKIENDPERMRAMLEQWAAIRAGRPASETYEPYQYDQDAEASDTNLPVIEPATNDADEQQVEETARKAKYKRLRKTRMSSALIPPIRPQFNLQSLLAMRAIGKQQTTLMSYLRGYQPPSKPAQDPLLEQFVPPRKNTPLLLPQHAASLLPMRVIQAKEQVNQVRQQAAQAKQLMYLSVLANQGRTASHASIAMPIPRRHPAASSSAGKAEPAPAEPAPQPQEQQGREYPELVGEPEDHLPWIKQSQGQPVSLRAQRNDIAFHARALPPLMDYAYRKLHSNMLTAQAMARATHAQFQQEPNAASAAKALRYAGVVQRIAQDQHGQLEGDEAGLDQDASLFAIPPIPQDLHAHLQQMSQHAPDVLSAFVAPGVALPPTAEPAPGDERSEREKNGDKYKQQLQWEAEHHQDPRVRESAQISLRRIQQEEDDSRRQYQGLSPEEEKRAEAFQANVAFHNNHDQAMIDLLHSPPYTSREDEDKHIAYVKMGMNYMAQVQKRTEPYSWHSFLKDQLRDTVSLPSMLQPERGISNRQQMLEEFARLSGIDSKEIDAILQSGQQSSSVLNEPMTPSQLTTLARMQKRYERERSKGKEQSWESYLDRSFQFTRKNFHYRTDGDSLATNIAPFIMYGKAVHQKYNPFGQQQPPAISTQTLGPANDGLISGTIVTGSGAPVTIGTSEDGNITVSHDDQAQVNLQYTQPTSTQDRENVPNRVFSGSPDDIETMKDYAQTIQKRLAGKYDRVAYYKNIPDHKVRAEAEESYKFYQQRPSLEHALDAIESHAFLQHRQKAQAQDITAFPEGLHGQIQEMEKHTPGFLQSLILPPAVKPWQPTGVTKEDIANHARRLPGSIDWMYNRLSGQPIQKAEHLAREAHANFQNRQDIDSAVRALKHFGVLQRLTQDKKEDLEDASLSAIPHIPADLLPLLQQMSQHNPAVLSAFVNPGVAIPPTEQTQQQQSNNAPLPGGAMVQREPGETREEALARAEQDRDTTILANTTRRRGDQAKEQHAGQNEVVPVGQAQGELSPPTQAVNGAKEAVEQIKAIESAGGSPTNIPSPAEISPVGATPTPGSFGGPNAIGGDEGGTSVVSDASQVIEKLRHEQDHGVVAGGTVPSGQSTADIKEQVQQGQQLMGQQGQPGGAAPTQEQTEEIKAAPPKMLDPLFDQLIKHVYSFSYDEKGPFFFDKELMGAARAVQKHLQDKIYGGGNNPYPQKFIEPLQRVLAARPGMRDVINQIDPDFLKQLAPALAGGSGNNSNPVSPQPGGEPPAQEQKEERKAEQPKILGPLFEQLYKHTDRFSYDKTGPSAFNPDIMGAVRMAEVQLRRRAYNGEQLLYPHKHHEFLHQAMAMRPGLRDIINQIDPHFLAQLTPPATQEKQTSSPPVAGGGAGGNGNEPPNKPPVATGGEPEGEQPKEDKKQQESQGANEHVLETLKDAPEPAAQEAGNQRPQISDKMRDLRSVILQGHPKDAPIDPDLRLHAPSDEQLRVINDPRQNRIIKGGPGGGKTTTLIRAGMHLVATGKLLPKDILSLSWMHSGRMALDDEHAKYKEMMPESDDRYVIPDAKTYHSLAHSILFDTTEEGNDGEIRYPVLEKAGFKNWSGRIIQSADDEDLIGVAPEEAAAMKQLSQQNFIKETLEAKGYDLGNVNMKEMLQDINKWKKSRGSSDTDNQDFDKAMDQGRDQRALGLKNDNGKRQLTNEIGLVEYQEEMERQGHLDQDDTLYYAGNALDTMGFAAVPSHLRNVRHIEADEVQDSSDSSLGFVKSFKSALEQGGNKVSTFLGIDEMQSLMQDMGGIKLNDIMSKLKTWLGLPDTEDRKGHHSLTRNFRSDASAVAEINAIPKHELFNGQAKSDPQTAESGRLGNKSRFILTKTQPALYRKMFKSMLETVGVEPKTIQKNIEQQQAAFKDVQWKDHPRNPESKIKQSPSQTPGIFTTRNQQALFEKEAKLYLMEEHGFTKEQADETARQIFRRDVVSKKNKKLYEQAESQFPIIRVGRARSLSFLFPHFDLSIAGAWILGGDEKMRSWLRNVYTGISRVAAGGHNTLFAATRPFKNAEHQRYMNHPNPHQLLSDTDPDDPIAGYAQLGNIPLQVGKEGSNINYPSFYEGEIVPTQFGDDDGFLATRDDELDRWIKTGKLPVSEEERALVPVRASQQRNTAALPPAPSAPAASSPPASSSSTPPPSMPTSQLHPPAGTSGSQEHPPFTITKEHADKLAQVFDRDDKKDWSTYANKSKRDEFIQQASHMHQARMEKWIASPSDVEHTLHALSLEHTVNAIQKVHDPEAAPIVFNRSQLLDPVRHSLARHNGTLATVFGITPRKEEAHRQATKGQQPQLIDGFDPKRTINSAHMPPEHFWKEHYGTSIYTPEKQLAGIITAMPDMIEHDKQKTFDHLGYYKKKLATYINLWRKREQGLDVLTDAMRDFVSVQHLSWARGLPPETMPDELAPAFAKIKQNNPELYKKLFTPIGAYQPTSMQQANPPAAPSNNPIPGLRAARRHSQEAYDAQLELLYEKGWTPESLQDAEDAMREEERRQSQGNNQQQGDMVVAPNGNLVPRGAPLSSSEELKNRGGSPSTIGNRQIGEAAQRKQDAQQAHQGHAATGRPVNGEAIKPLPADFGVVRSNTPPPTSRSFYHPPILAPEQKPEHISTIKKAAKAAPPRQHQQQVSAPVIPEAPIVRYDPKEAARLKQIKRLAQSIPPIMQYRNDEEVNRRANMSLDELKKEATTVHSLFQRNNNVLDAGRGIELFGLLQHRQQEAGNQEITAFPEAFHQTMREIAQVNPDFMQSFAEPPISPDQIPPSPEQPASPATKQRPQYHVLTQAQREAGRRKRDLLQSEKARRRMAQFHPPAQAQPPLTPDDTWTRDVPSGFASLASDFLSQHFGKTTTPIHEVLAQRIGDINQLPRSPEAIEEHLGNMKEAYNQYIASGGNHAHLADALSSMYATHALQHDQKLPLEAVPQRLLDAHELFAKTHPDALNPLPHARVSNASASPTNTGQPPTIPPKTPTPPSHTKAVGGGNNGGGGGNRNNNGGGGNRSGGNGGGGKSILNVDTITINAGTVNINSGGGGSGGGGNGGGGKKKGKGWDFHNTLSEFGHSVARISSEFQFLGQGMDQLATQAAKQGAEYRRATLSLGPAASGTDGTSGYFNFTNDHSGISQLQQNTLPMYSDSAIVQQMKSLTGMTGTRFSPGATESATTDIMGIAALSGMDASTVMNQMVGASGWVGGGPDATVGRIGKMTGMLTNVFGNNLTSDNVGQSLSALNQMLPVLQGNANNPQSDQTSDAMAFIKLAMNAGMSSENLPQVAQTIGNLSNLGANPNLQQQYKLGQLFGKEHLTGDTDYVNYQSEENNRQQQIKELSLQQDFGAGISLPNLDIKISQAQIQMDKAQLDMSQFNQQYAQAQYGVSVFQDQYAHAQYQNAVFEHQYSQAQYQQAQFQQQYNVAQYQNAAWQQQYSQAQYNQNQYMQNQLYGPIGADLSKTAYFSWQQNQAAAQYNRTSPEQALTYQPAQPFGLKNEEFYSGMEHQRTQMVLGRSSLLSDMAFQENLKNIDKQEEYYKREMDLQNQQRAFDKDWKQQELDHANTMLGWQKRQVDQNEIMLGWQKKQLDQQGTMLAWQKKQVDLQTSMLGWQKEQLDKQAGILAIQEKQFDLESTKAQYEQQKDTIQNDYLKTQIDDLQAVSRAMGQQLNGDGTLNGQNVTPEQIVQKLADLHKNDKDGGAALRKDIQGLGLSAEDQRTLFLITQQVEKTGGGIDAIKKQLDAANHTQLRDNLKHNVSNGSFADAVKQSGLENAFLQLGGIGENWKNLIHGIDTANGYLKTIAQWASSQTGTMATLGPIINLIGGVGMGIASIINLLGLVGGAPGGLAGMAKWATGTAAPWVTDTALPAIGGSSVATGTIAGTSYLGLMGGSGWWGWNNYSKDDRAKGTINPMNDVFIPTVLSSVDHIAPTMPVGLAYSTGQNMHQFLDAMNDPTFAKKVYGKDGATIVGGVGDIFRTGNWSNFWGGVNQWSDDNFRYHDPGTGNGKKQPQPSGDNGWNKWWSDRGGDWNNMWGNINTWSDQNLRYHDPGDSSGVDPNLMVDSTSVMSDGSNPLRRRQPQPSGSSWTDNVHTFFTKTLPDWFTDHVGGPVGTFFSKGLPDWFTTHVGGPVGTFFSKGLPDWFTDHVSGPVGTFFSKGLPDWFTDHVSGPVKTFFSKGLPDWFTDHVGGPVNTFFSKGLPDWFTDHVGGPVNTFFTKGLPNWFTDHVGGPAGTFFTKTLPGIFSPVQIFFSKIHEYFNTYIWSPATVLFTQTIPDFFLKKLPKMVTDALAKLNPFAGTGGTPRGGTPAGHSGFTTPQVYQEFGVNNPKRGPHYGVDFAAAQGTPIGEFIGGKVKSTGHYDWGYEVDVELPNGMIERYVHLSMVGVHAGQKLKKGDFVGLSGGGTPESGLGYYSDGPHLHYQTDYGVYNNAVSPWTVLAMYGDKNILPEFGGIHPQATGGRGAGGAGFYQMDGAEKRAHLYQGGVAMSRMKAEIAEQEPEAIVPISKLTSILQSTFRQTTSSEPVATPAAGKAPITLTKLAEKLELHVHTTAQTLDEHAQDDLMAQLLEIVSTALREYNGKLN